METLVFSPLNRRIYIMWLSLNKALNNKNLSLSDLDKVQTTPRIGHCILNPLLSVCQPSPDSMALRMWFHDHF